MRASSRYPQSSGWSRRRNALRGRGLSFIRFGSVIALLAGCSSSQGARAEPTESAGLGGSDAAAVTPPVGGHSSSAAGGSSFAGASSNPTALAGSSGSSAGGAEPVSLSGGNAGTAHDAPGAAGSAVASGGQGGAAGSAAGAPSATPLGPPVRDSASKVPISKAPGYTVEGNYAYGPLTAQRLDLLYPPSAGPNGTQTLPVVLMFHGGAWIHSYTNDYGSGKDHMSTFFNRFLAHGFIVCNAEYRVNDGTADGAPAPAAVQDALLAAKWCWDYMDYFHGDRARFVVTGASAGGHLALMVGMTTPEAALGPTTPRDFQIAAIVSGYGPADIEAEINAVAKGWIPTNLANRAAIAKLVNPISYVRSSVPPLIDVHGANDTTAPVADSQHLNALLKAAGADASLHLVPNADHGFTDATWPDAEQAMFNWLTARGLGH